MDSRDFEKEVMAMPLPKDLTQDIWDRQAQLMASYKDIEKWEVNWPLNLNIKSSQLLIKDMIARSVEELAEGYESFLENNMENTMEELADAIHFLVEAFILCGIRPDDKNDLIKNYHVDHHPYFIDILNTDRMDTGAKVSLWFWKVTYHLNLARNALRNKPWKQTQMLYNQEVFEKELWEGLRSLIIGFRILNAGPYTIWRDYVKKNLANQFRIKSKY